MAHGDLRGDGQKKSWGQGVLEKLAKISWGETRGLVGSGEAWVAIRGGADGSSRIVQGLSWHFVFLRGLAAGHLWV